MTEKETPGTPQNDSTTSKAPGATPGGSPGDAAVQSPSTPVSPPDRALQFLLALIAKLREPGDPPTPDE